MSRERPVSVLGLLAFLVFIIALAECSSYVFIGQYLARRAAYLVYNPAAVTPVEHDDYMLARHPLLGWPSVSEYGGDLFDRTGSRIVPAFPEPGDACVSLYGDSFTWGAEVGHEAAWPNALALRLGCRVANYGVSGYGADQALLRFLDNDDESPVVVLTVFAENIQRHVNQLASLRTGNRNTRAFKPRFVIGSEGSLEVVPLPTFSRDEFQLIIDDPKSFLKHEYFLPDTPGGPGIPSFPYTGFVLRSLGNERVRTKLSGRPSFAGFYSPAHPSGAVHVTAGIVERFVSEAESRGKRAVVLLLPTGSGLKHYERKGAWTFQPLIDLLEERGIGVGNLGEDLLDRVDAREHCRLKTKPDICQGHYNEEGNALLAEIVHQRLEGTVAALRADRESEKLHDF
jgi:hypothetical protein